MNLEFSKYHGAGNDFVMVDNRNDDKAIWDLLTEENIARLCARNFGVGADGLIQAIKSNSDVPYTMGYFNADGTPAEMCGNGLRCLMRYLADLGEPVREMEEVKIMTGGGVVLSRFVDEDTIQVAMPIPSFEPKDAKIALNEPAVNYPLEIPGISGKVYGTAVGVGNPHFVIYSTEMWEGSEVHEIGSRIAIFQDMFPEGVNVGFARKEAPDTCALVVYERGVGPTLACGSGAIAAISAGVLEGRFDYEQPVRVRMPGGEIKVTIGKDWRYAVLEGRADKVFTGNITL